MKLIASCDDGCASDIKFSKLCVKYKIPCTFYIPIEWTNVAFTNGYRPLTAWQVEKLAERHQIGSHGITHQHLTKMPLEFAQEEITGSRRILQGWLGSDNGWTFAPSRGYISPELKSYAMVYYDSIRLTKGENLVHIHPNSGANNNRDWRDVLHEKSDMNEVEVWCHSWELDKYNLWEQVEEIFKEYANGQSK